MKFTKIIIPIIIMLLCSASILLSISERELTVGGNQKTIFSYAAFFEDRFFDQRMKLTLSEKNKNNDLILLAIDDQSLLSLGRFPWPRKIFAELIHKLTQVNAKIIAFDVFFSEPELACGINNNDNELKQAIINFQKIPNRKVILPYSIANNYLEGETFKDIPDDLLSFALNAAQNKGANINQAYIEKKVFPIQPLLDASPGLAHIEAMADSDGVFRHYPIVSNINSIYLPSFALLTYSSQTEKNVKINIIDSEHAEINTPNGILPINMLGESKIRWAGGSSHFPTISIQDFLSHTANYQWLNNKTIFIASTAFGAHDLRNTPVDSALPGIFFHMSMVEMLNTGKYFVSSEKNALISISILIIGTLIILAIMNFENAILDFISINLIILFILALDIKFYIPNGYSIRLFFALLSMVLCYTWSTFINFYQASLEKKKIRGTFSRYLSPAIVSELLNNPDKVKLGGEKKVVTVFFSDVRDFTTISEQLSPEKLSQSLNIYMTMMTDTLFSHQGTLDKYIGDAMVAFWGAPVELKNHASLAIQCAIEMTKMLPLINDELKAIGSYEFKHGIGINTGECTIGNMGSQQIFSYTSIGDSMNLGARLESLCKFYQAQIIISEYTWDTLTQLEKNQFLIRPLDKVIVKGKLKPVLIFEVLHPQHLLYDFPLEVERFTDCFTLYIHQKFEAALKILSDLHDLFPNDPTILRIKNQCQQFIKNPPAENWDGSFIHLRK